jgi:hypothetical protein
LGRGIVLERVLGQVPLALQHLETTIHTGMLCRYAPDPRFSVRWALD